MGWRPSENVDPFYRINRTNFVYMTVMEIMNGKHLCSIEYADDVNMKIKNFITN